MPAQPREPCTNASADRGVAGVVHQPSAFASQRRHDFAVNSACLLWPLGFPLPPPQPIQDVLRHLLLSYDMAGKFIVIEGPNRAGKSTLIEKLAEALTSAGVAVVCTKEPGGTGFGNALRRVLKDPELQAGGFASALVFEGSRREHLDEVVLPALAEGKVVLCDRYFDSTEVYQCRLAEPRLTSTEVKLLREVHETFTPPDLTIFLLPSQAVVDARGADTDDRFAGSKQEYLAYQSVATTACDDRPLTLVLRVELDNTDLILSAAMAGLKILGVI